LCEANARSTACEIHLKKIVWGHSLQRLQEGITMSFIGEIHGNSTIGGTAMPLADFNHPRRRATDTASRPLAPQSDNSNLSTDNVESFLSMFCRVGFGYLVLDEYKKIIKWNKAARIALDVEANSKDEAKAISTAFKQLMSPVAYKFVPGSVSWVAIPYKDARPIVVRDETVINNDNMSIVLLLSRETSPDPNPQRLQQMFGLTCAEVQLATSLVHGQSPLEIAHQCNVSRTTIRSHLAALFSKTDTNRQSELVALLRQVSVLP
jgi:DNA-binding CsgD family transcriptional regulator